jgi:hypothetical protein
MKKATVSANRKRIGRPPVGSINIGVRVPPNELGVLDAWIVRQPDKPSRPEALRRLASKALASKKPAAGRSVSVPAERLTELDAWAVANKLTRSEAVLAVIDAGIMALIPHTRVPASSKPARKARRAL